MVCWSVWFRADGISWLCRDFCLPSGVQVLRQMSPAKVMTRLHAFWGTFSPIHFWLGSEDTWLLRFMTHSGFSPSSDLPTAVLWPRQLPQTPQTPPLPILRTVHLHWSILANPLSWRTWAPYYPKLLCSINSLTVCQPLTVKRSHGLIHLTFAPYLVLMLWKVSKH